MPLMNPDHWVQTHLRAYALSSWDNEGGASRTRETVHPVGLWPLMDRQTWFSPCQDALPGRSILGVPLPC